MALDSTRTLEINNKYFEFFQNKDLNGLRKLYADKIRLKDWLGEWIGVDSVLDENVEFFKNDFTLNGGIKINELTNFFENSNRIIQDKIKKVQYNKTQIYRTNTTNLNCQRHFKVFDKYQIIPKFCFSCFKIQIEPKNVLGLINLFFIFDK